MRKWGLHYLLSLMFVAVLLAGCGSAGNDNTAADNAATESSLSVSGSDSSADSGAAPAESAEESGAMASTTSADQAGGANAVGGGGSASIPRLDSEKTAEAASGISSGDVAAGLNKKLIYKANLVMEVKDYTAAQTEVRNMVTLAGGYIIEFSENVSDFERGGTFILKVPASGFSPFLDNLEKIENENLQRSIQGQDVSEEYVDLESTLKAKELMEKRYLEFMEQATKSADLVAFANQLGAIQEEIAQIKGRMRYIDQNVSFSTVELRLYQVDDLTADAAKKEQDPLLSRASDAWKGSLNALSVTFQWLFVFLSGALPVLVVIGVIVAIALFIRKKSKRRESELLERLRSIGRPKPGETLPPGEPLQAEDPSGPGDDREKS
ncbi:DUF4349 domain-containing protein ['Paenibacillus yunnanensis' Narsing Rao et al. 2020]|uniref:DUF4349 domain-containing protein n=1 Tax=Paenibacillus tengchongensis TaxID=2608684 RepID=UPI00124DA471|nr:DUF4349 domain-containing protein [Paenibacillus tengchongensis]